MKTSLFVIGIMLVFVSVVSATPIPQFLLMWGGHGYGPGQFTVSGQISVDKDGKVYVTDLDNHRVQVFTSEGIFVAEFGRKGNQNGEFSLPWGVAVDQDGFIYVTDGYPNARVQKFSPQYQFVKNWGSYGRGDGQFKTIGGIAVDNDGYVYVADAQNARIQKFDTNGNFVLAWSCESPVCVALDKSGDVYVSSYDTVSKFTSEGAYLTRFGGLGRNDGQFFGGAYGMAIDESTGDIFVTDAFNNRVQVFKKDGTFSWKWEASESSPFDNPWSIVFDSFGNIYVTEFKNRQVLKFSYSSGTSIVPIGNTTWGAIKVLFR